MKQLLFENRNGIMEATLNESLSGAFTKGALLLGYMGLMTLAVINPRVTTSDMSHADNIFGFMFKALNDRMKGNNRKEFNSDVEKMVERMNELNEASAGKITPETIIKVLGKAGELTEDQEKYLVASYYYREYLNKLKTELEAYDPEKDDAKSRNQSGAWKEKMQNALDIISGNKEAEAKPAEEGSKEGDKENTEEEKK